MADSNEITRQKLQLLFDEDPRKLFLFIYFSSHKKNNLTTYIILSIISTPISIITIE
jgi:hypothetical protein